MDQVDRTGELVRFPASGGAPDRIAVSSGAVRLGAALPLPDGRVLLPSLIAGRNRLLAVTPRQDPIPWLDTREETASPAALVGTLEVAFLLGTPPEQTIAVASIADGRIVRRLKGAKGVAITSLAASPDGKTLYYTASGTVWAIPSADGDPRKIHAGDAVAADPRGPDLIVKLQEKEGIRLVRIPLSGGQEQPIPVQGEFRLTPLALSPSAVGKDGRIVLGVSVRDSWYWPPAILDPATGKVERIPMYEADYDFPGWTSDGRIMAVALPVRSGIWRFRPAAPPKAP